MGSINSFNGMNSRMIPAGIDKGSAPNKDKTTEAAVIGAARQADARHMNSAEAVEDLKKTINAIQGPQKSLEISVHKETNSIMIKVKNKETGELIREAPPQKVLEALATLMEVTGLIVDKKI